MDGYFQKKEAWEWPQYSAGFVNKTSSLVSDHIWRRVTQEGKEEQQELYVGLVPRNETVLYGGGNDELLVPVLCVLGL